VVGEFVRAPSLGIGFGLSFATERVKGFLMFVGLSFPSACIWVGRIGGAGLAIGLSFATERVNGFLMFVGLSFPSACIWVGRIGGAGLAAGLEALFVVGGGLSLLVCDKYGRTGRGSGLLLVETSAWRVAVGLALGVSSFLAFDRYGLLENDRDDGDWGFLAC
jgi:hypothetical protein